MLLHALYCMGAEWRSRLTAIYIDHQLHKDSKYWASHCEAFCRVREIPFHAAMVEINHYRHMGVEGAARKARYTELASRLTAGEGLLTAHHLDDQAETVLIQLLRGAGPQGLAAMPECKPIGAGLHLRPLLPFSRDELYTYAVSENLSWINDPSNDSLRHDRNYIRHHVLPVLRKRWPLVNQTLLQGARWQAECINIQSDLARVDFGFDVSEHPDRLPVDALRQLADYRQRNLLRAWIQANGFTVPGMKQLNTLLQQALSVGESGSLLVAWSDCQVRCYRNCLYIMHTLQPCHQDLIRWCWRKPLEIEPLGLVLRPGDLVNQLGREPTSEQLTVRFRRGGERVRLEGRAGMRTLKKVFQELGIPPWQRARIPLIYQDDQLLLVWGMPISIASAD